MNLIVFAIIVLLLAVLMIWLVDLIPGLNPPVSAVAKILILLVAIIVISNRAGLF